MNVKLALLKPVVSPAAYPDESAKGFIMRLAAINNYAKCSWLFDAGYRDQMSSKTIFDYLVQIPWSGFGDINYQTKEIYSSCATALRCGSLKYCPQCLISDGYLQASWELTLSYACVKHRCWLVPVDCENTLLKKSPDAAQCEPNRTVFSQRAPESVLRWQAFLENKKLPENGSVPLLLNNPEIFTLKERLDVGYFYQRWIHAYPTSTRLQILRRPRKKTAPY